MGVGTEELPPLFEQDNRVDYLGLDEGEIREQQFLIFNGILKQAIEESSDLSTERKFMIENGILVNPQSGKRINIEKTNDQIRVLQEQFID